MEASEEKLNVYMIAREQCAPDKEVTHVISRHNMLHLILSGKGVFNGRQLHAGQAFLCAANREVTYYPDRDDPWCYVYFNSYGSEAERLLARAGFHGNSVVDFPTDGRMLSLLELSTSHDDPLFRRGMFSALTAMLSPGEAHEPGHAERLYARAVEYAESKSGAVTPSGLAEALGISRSYLRNLFTRFGGCSAQTYLIGCRMTRAKELLISTDCPVSVIAGTVGYDDPFCFTRAFTTHEGISPTRYRASYKNDLSHI